MARVAGHTACSPGWCKPWLSCSADGSEFWIAVIPHTWSSTTLQQLRPGDAVNLEADLLAKYTERLLAPAGTEGPVISGAWLAEHGWG